MYLVKINVYLLYYHLREKTHLYTLLKKSEVN